MKIFTKATAAIAISLAVCTTNVMADSVGTAFTYQGQLKDAGKPVDETCDLQFTLYDAATAGSQVGSTVSTNGVQVDNGLFTVNVDFGTDAFDGDARWLEISVRCPAGSGSYTTLQPRQRLAATPYAQYATSAGSTGWTTDGSYVVLENDTDSVGVGTPTPAYKLDVDGTVGASNFADSDNDDYFVNPASTGEAAVLAGRVGVRGNPFWTGFSPGWGPDLHVRSASGDDTAYVYIGDECSTAGDIVGYIGFTGQVGGTVLPPYGPYASIQGEIAQYGTNAKGRMVFDTREPITIPSPPPDMCIESNGYVGIRVENALARLHLGGTPGTDGIMFPDGTLQTTAAGSGSSGWVDDGSSVRLASSSDNVGIGTTSPGTKLEVRDTAGGVRASYDATRWIQMMYAGGTGPLLQADGYTRLTIDADAGAAGEIVLGAGGDDVAIGKTGPTSKLDVNGTATVTGLKMSTGAATGHVLTADASGNATWQAPPAGIGGSGTTNYIPKFTSSSTLGGSSIYQDSAGRIGIGTTSPDYNMLHVHSDYSIFKMTNSGTGTTYNDGTILGYTAAAGTSACLWNRENGNLVFATDNAERMRIHSGGNIAIGHTAPWCKLDVRSSDGDRVVYAEYEGTEDADCIAVQGHSFPRSGRGFGGQFSGGRIGVMGSGGLSGLGGNYGTGVYGVADGNTGPNYGVHGWASGSGTKYGVYGEATGSGTNWAGYFDGNVTVTGNIYKNNCYFKIDHPIDPENRYLTHAAVESPDLKTVYDGVAILDDDGQAWIDLPDYFEALNGDHRYQLTCIGGYAPVFIAEKIAKNRFKIAGGESGMEVSWQVTGIRKDPAALAGKTPVELDKSVVEVGKYIHPQAYGMDRSMGVDYHEPPVIPQYEPEAEALQ